MDIREIIYFVQTGIRLIFPGLDYNGVFESFYEMKYGTTIDYDRYAEGIEAEEFESLIMEYLPVTKEELRDYAEYDAETGTYLWVRLGTGNYSPTTFGNFHSGSCKGRRKRERHRGTDGAGGVYGSVQ